MNLSKDEIFTMLDNPLIQQVLFEVMDEDVVGFDVLTVLVDSNEITDDEISRQLEVKLNNIRRILYKLYEARLVDYNREKDEETNWYTYTWKPSLEKLPALVVKKMKNVLNSLKQQLSLEETSMFFQCGECELKFTFEDAMDMGFRCPQCNGLIHEYDNKKDISTIKDQIRYLEEEFTQNPLFSKY